MKPNAIFYLVRFIIALIAVCGIYLCICVYPFLTSISTLTTSAANSSKLFAWLAFMWTVSAPCFIILIIAWISARAIKKDDVFSLEVSRKIKICARILFADTTALLIGAAVFGALRIIDLFLPIVFVLIIVGFSLAIFTAVLSSYVTKAAILREENEGTI